MRLGEYEIQSTMTLLVLKTWLSLNPFGLLIMRQHCRPPRAFSSGDFLALFMIYAYEAMLSVNSRRDGNGSCLPDYRRYTAMATT